MGVWAFIFGLGFIMAGVSSCYLAHCFAKLSPIKRIRGERKKLGLLFGFLIVAVLLVALWVTIGVINAFIAFFHLMFFWIVADLLWWIVAKCRKGKKFVISNAPFVLVFTVLYLCVGWYGAHHVVATQYQVTTDKVVGNFRIVQFADSHVGSTFHWEKFAELAKEMEAEQPDAVLITGDYVDDDTDREDMVECCRILGQMKTTYGVYYVFGNHDKGYYGSEYRGFSAEDLIAELEKNGITVLQDEGVLLDNRIYLLGRQDRSQEQRGGRATMEELTKLWNRDTFCVVMDHQPNDYYNEAASGVDLVLSGHTHGGQLIPFNHMGYWTGMDDKTYGMEKRDDTTFIVSSGISDWTIKFKTGCMAEYVVVDICGK